MKSPVKIRKTHKIEKKKNTICISVFACENKVKYQTYLSKKICEDKHLDLKKEEEIKRQYVLIKNFNTFLYDYTLHRERRYFGRYCSQGFKTVETLTCHIKNYFNINGKQRIKTSKKRQIR